MAYPKGKPKSEESKRKASEALKGRKRPEGFGKRVAATRVANGNHRPSEETKKKIGDANRRSQALKREQGLPLPQHSQRGQSKNFVSWEAEPEPVEEGPKSAQSVAVKGSWETRRAWSDEKKAEYSKKLSDAKKKQWADGVYENRKPAARRRVSKTERLLSPVAEALGYRHNDSAQEGYFYIPLGGGKGMTPDFVDREGRRVLEYFGNFWHHPDDEAYYVEAYASAGWECRVVWESDLPLFIKEAELSDEDRGALNDHLCQLNLEQAKGNLEMVSKRSQAVKGKEGSDVTDPEAS